MTEEWYKGTMVIYSYFVNDNVGRLKLMNLIKKEETELQEAESQEIQEVQGEKEEKSSHKKAKSNKREGRFFRRMITFLIIIIILIIAVCVLMITFKKVFNVESEQSTYQVTLKEELEDIAELATEEYTRTDWVKSSDQKKLFNKIKIPLTKKSYIMIYTGVVKAGIEDASAIEVSIDSEKQVVTVTIPDIVILDAYIDMDNVDILDEEFTVFNKYSVSEITEALSGLTDDLEDYAIDAGILDDAESNAKDLMEKIILANMGDDYTVVFE